MDLNNINNSNVEILINNFSKEYKKFENGFSRDKILFFKNVNNLIFLIIDFCIKNNILKNKKNYSTVKEFVYIFQEDLIHFLFSEIDINDDTYNDNVKLFSSNGDDNSYYKDYEINMNDYGTLNTYNTYQSYNSHNSTKFKQECDKISLYIYVLSCQNKFNDLLEKLKDMINDYFL